MPDFDLEATAEAKSALRGAVPEGLCGQCSKRMYKEPPYPGVASEWRHASTGQPLSWSPGKHLASLTQVNAHAHRFAFVKGSAFEACTVQGCDAEMQHVGTRQERREVALSERERATQESRARGQARGRASQKKAIPF